MASPRLQAVLFDLDGTLLDTAPDFIEVVHQLRREHDLDLLPEPVIRSQVSNGARALVQLALGVAEGEHGFAEKRLRLLDIYAQVLGRHTVLFPGLAGLLSTLDSRGVSWGIVTNKPEYLTVDLLARLDLKPAPATVICPDHVTHTKPHAEPILLACSELNCDPTRSIYVGDHQRDIESGRAAGARTIAAGYGYLEAGDDVHDWNADHVAMSGAELTELIDSYL